MLLYGDGLAVGRRWPAAAGRPDRRFLAAERLLGDLGDTAEGADDARRLDRQHQDLLIRRFGEAFQRLDIVVGYEIVDRLHAARGDRVGHHLRCLGFGFGGALARLRIAERRLAAAFGLEDLRLLEALGGEDGGLPLTLRLENGRTLLALGLHLPAHRLHQVARRIDILDFDARDLDAPRRHRSIDHAQQPRVDLVAMAEELV